MIVDQLIDRFNRLGFHKLYILSPHSYAVGNCGEEIYLGLIKAQNENRRLVLVSTYDFPRILKYRFSNRAILTLESPHILKLNIFWSFLISSILTIIYIPTRRLSLFYFRHFKKCLPEPYNFPRIGYNNLFVPSVDITEFSWEIFHSLKWKDLFQKKIPIQISDNDLLECDKVMRKLGIPEGAWYVCLHVRESGYRNDAGRREYRNSQIRSYIAGIEEVTSRGGWVIRMGDNTMERLPKMENVIDYPHTPYKSELMDLYLIALCRFYIGCQSGIHDVAKVFQKNILLLNMVNWTFGGPLKIQDRGILKRIYYKPERRLLSLYSLHQGDWQFDSPPLIDSDDFEFHDNSPEEIREAISEYITLIEKNDFSLTPLQKKVNDLRSKLSFSIFNRKNLNNQSLMEICSGSTLYNWCRFEYDKTVNYSRDEEVYMKYRFAIQAIDGFGTLCQGFLERNWEE